MLTANNIKQIHMLMVHYLASPSRLERPLKLQLTSAVRALMRPGAGKLSRNWTKTHLATAIKRWSGKALQTDPEAAARDLFIDIKSDSRAPDEM